jgi:hypothetical protein
MTLTHEHNRLLQGFQDDERQGWERVDRVFQALRHFELVESRRHNARHCPVFLDPSIRRSKIFFTASVFGAYSGQARHFQ